MKIFIDNAVIKNVESFVNVGDVSGIMGPVSTIIEVEKVTVLGRSRTAFFVINRNSWFNGYDRYYNDPGCRSGMTIRVDLARVASNTMNSVYAMFVEQEDAFFGLSCARFWNYVAKFHKIRPSLEDDAVLDAACPRTMWARMTSQNKHDL